MNNVDGTKDLWTKAIERGAVKAVDYKVMSEGIWKVVHTSFYDTKEGNEDGLYHEVGRYNPDLNSFTPEDRMVASAYVETDEEALDLYRSGKRTFNGLFLSNDDFGYFIAIQREISERKSYKEAFMFDRQIAVASALDESSPVPFNEHNRQRQSVRLFSNIGRVWDTEINGSRKEVLNYFLGQSFEYDENKPTDMVVVVLFGAQKVPASSFTKEQALSALEQWKKSFGEPDAGNDHVPG